MLKYLLFNNILTFFIMDKKLFHDCVQAIDACFYLISSNVGLSIQDKICIQHIYEKVGFTLSECFRISANES